MTTRNIALAINTTAIPEVGRLLANQGIQLGRVTAQKDRLRCFAITGDHTPRLPLPEGGLSLRDLIILHGFADGLSFSAIAETLHVTEAAVRTHCTKRLYRKLRAKDKAEAVAIACRMGVFDQKEAAA